MTPAPEGSRRRMAFGVVLVVAGGLWLAERLGWVTFDGAVLLPAVVALVGVAAVVASFDGPHSGLVAAGSVLAVLTVLVAALPGVGGGIGDRRIVIASASDLESPYRLGVGSLTLDLSAMPVAEVVEVVADVGVGELVVIVPEEARLEVVASSEAGSVQLLGERAEGIDVARSYRSPGAEGEIDRLVLDLGVTLGEVQVRR